MKPPERERLKYIHDCLKNEGHLSVQSMQIKFKISHPTASKSVKVYRELAPLNMALDQKTKRYVRLESFIDIEIPKEIETKNMVLVHVVEVDRALVSGSNYKHWEVYRAGVFALGLTRK